MDLDPKVKSEPPPTPRRSREQFERALKRDLEWLFNTRRVPEEIPESCSEVLRSVYAFGLPDFTALGLSSSQDQVVLQRLLESTIKSFEPRILNPRVIMQSDPGGMRVLRFHIEGMMRIDPAPEPISFDTVLELSSGDYKVK